ncbi:carboxypeptidase-like regulatory domain-containing protein [Bremerella sp. JC770]|uniref:carboxypeptidase-like regulatory domain-containing protein n=1 Tax=Bremerella sp. JC770 TaxID=3232137 RepID=UPI00345AE83D
MKSSLTLLCTVALGLALLGCNKNENLGTITGTVTYEGAPVTEGTISFRSEESGLSASDELDAEGKFEVTAVGGIPPGNYKAFIVPPEVEVSLGPDVAPVLKPKDMPNVPRPYRSIRTTPLAVDVVAGANEVSFELKK